MLGKSAAEIVQFHPTSHTAFAINAVLNQIEVIDLAGLTAAPLPNPITDNSLQSTAFTFADSVLVKDVSGMSHTIALGVANSIAIDGDVLAITVQARIKTDIGALSFYRLDDDLPNPCDETQGLDCPEVAISADLGPQGFPPFYPG